MGRQKISFKLGSGSGKAATADSKKRKASIFGEIPDTARKSPTSKPGLRTNQKHISPESPSSLLANTSLAASITLNSPISGFDVGFGCESSSDMNEPRVKEWQSVASAAGAKPGRDFKRNASSDKSHSRHSSSSSARSRAHATQDRGFRKTDKYIFFWGSVLSNWNRGPNFSGVDALAYLLPRLDSLNIKHLDSNAFATKLLSTHQFNCGEQFMMACKSWLFEAPKLNLAVEDTTTPTHLDFQFRYDRLMEPRLLTDSTEEKTLHESSLMRILRAADPKTQKGLGRNAPGFDELIWESASRPIVVAACVARAEADQQLADIYVSNKDGERHFVEGSSYDKIWGVGIHWNDPKIEDSRNWRGANRLGQCHDEACRLYCENHGLRMAVADPKELHGREEEEDLTSTEASEVTDDSKSKKRKGGRKVSAEVDKKVKKKDVPAKKVQDWQDFANRGDK